MAFACLPHPSTAFAATAQAVAQPQQKKRFLLGLFCLTHPKKRRKPYVGIQVLIGCGGPVCDRRLFFHGLVTG